MRLRRDGVFRACIRLLMVLGGVLGCGNVGVLLVSASGAVAATCSNVEFRAGVSEELPDCRAYEQVSPTEKGGFNAYPSQGLPAEVPSSGEQIAYLGYESFPGASGNAAFHSAHLGVRTASGWQTTEITPTVPNPEPLTNYSLSYAFSEDLSQAILRVPLEPLTSDATPGIYNMFLRRANGTYQLVNSARPTRSIGELCPPFLLTRCYLFKDVSTYAGASSDLRHIMFESNAQLTPEAPVTEIESLYESTEGRVGLVGILPDGASAQGSTAGAGSNVNERADRRIQHAISQDGSHIVFQAQADGGEPDPAQSGDTEVYDRINGNETIELSAAAPGAKSSKCETRGGFCEPEPAQFWAASADGSIVYFASKASLTKESVTGPEESQEARKAKEEERKVREEETGEAGERSMNPGNDLYRYDVNSGTLTDLTVDSTDPNGAEVLGVVNASSDGSYVYFAAKGQLVSGKGVDGQPNLYMVHDGGAPVFIATLNGSGSCEFSSRSYSDLCDWTPSPYELEAYVTPDGRHAAFMSTMMLPTANFPAGYINADVNTSEPDSEVYEYTAPTSVEEGRGKGGWLVCASCDPSGAPPFGNALIGGITEAERGAPPVYTPISTPFYSVRALTDDGERLFYTAPLARTEHQDKVYEYEQSGAGSCPVGEDCHFVLSSMVDPESDQFLGASASGNDVFFATAGKLSSTDVDELGDVYDARVDGGFALPSVESACENDCRQAGSALASPPLVGTSTGSSGNVTPERQVASKKVRRSRKSRKCGKGWRRSRGKCVKGHKKPTAGQAHGGGWGHS
jgi:hypothetical protein